MLTYKTFMIKNFITNMIKSKYWNMFLLLLEFITVWVEVANTFCRLLSTLKKREYNCVSYLNYVNLTFYLNSLVGYSDSNSEFICPTKCSIPDYFIFLIFFIYFLLTFINHMVPMIEYNTHKSEIGSHSGKIGRFRKSLDWTSTNIIYIYQKVFGCFIFNLFLSPLFANSKLDSNNDTQNIQNIQILSTFFFIFFALTYIYNSYYIFLVFKINEEYSLVCDLFSRKFDTIICCIKILAALNNNLVNNKDHQLYPQLSFFFDGLIILIFIVMIIYFPSQILAEKEFSLIANYDLNLMRLWFLKFINGLNFILAVFTISNEIYFLISTVCCIFISSLLTHFLKLKITHLILEDKKQIYFMMLILDMYIKGSYKKLKLSLMRINTFENTEEIKNKTKKNSKILESEENQYTDFFQKIFDMLHSQKTSNSLTNLEKDIIFFLHLGFKKIYNEKHSLSNTILLFEMKKYFSKNMSCLHNNIGLFEFLLNHRNNEKITDFKAIKCFDTCCHILMKASDLLEEIILTINLNLKKDLYEYIRIFAKHCQDIPNKIQDVFSRYKIHKVFNTNLLYYLYHNIFNKNLRNYVKQLSSFDDDIGSISDLMTDNYINDNFLLIKYSVKPNSLIIKRGSRRFSNFQEQNFEEIFPKALKQTAKKMFIDSICQHIDRFSFQFIINDINQIYVESVIFQAEIYKSLDSNEFYIICQYEISKDDFIVLEIENQKTEIENFFDRSDEAFLFNYSKNLEETVKIIPFSSHTTFPKIYFSDIFKPISEIQIPLTSNPTNDLIPANRGKNKISRYFSIDYAHFLEILQEKFKFHIVENESLDMILKEIQNLAKLKTITKVEVFERYLISSVNKYFVFSVHILNNKKKKLSGFLNGDTFLQLKKININDKNKITDAAILSVPHSNTSSVNSKQSNNLNSYGHNKSFSYSPASKNTSLKMKNFSLITFVINILIVFYCVLLLVIGIRGNQNLKDLYEVKYSFDTFRLLFFQTGLTLYYNAVINKEKTSTIGYDFQIYWKKFKNYNTTLKFEEYAFSELFVKSDLLNEQFLKLKTIFYQSSYASQFSPLLNFHTSMMFMQVENNTPDFQSANISFSESITVLINNFKSIKQKPYIPQVYIINFDVLNLKFDLYNIWDKNIIELQKATYDLAVNYPIFYKNIENLGYEINSIFQAEIYKILIINNILTILLIVFRLLLLIVFIAIISFLKHTANKSNRRFFKIVTKDYATFALKKLEILKSVIDFYSQDPVQNVKKIQILVDERKLKHKNDEISNKKSGEDIKKVKRNEQSKINWKKLIAPIIKSVAILYCFYIIYALSFILISKNLSTKFSQITQYNENIELLNNNLMNCVMLLETLLFTNQSDISFTKYFSEQIPMLSGNIKKDYGFVNNLIEANLNLYSINLKYQSQLYELKQIQDSINNLTSCDYFYTNIKDPIYEKLKNNYNDTPLLPNLMKLCNSFPQMHLHDYMKIIEYINYSNLKLIFQYQKDMGIYSKVKELNDIDEFYDQFTILVLVIRPIQTYINDVLIKDYINSSQSDYLKCILVNLSLNILVEIIIFFIINKIIIKNVLVIDEEISILLSSLE